MCTSEAPFAIREYSDRPCPRTILESRAGQWGTVCIWTVQFLHAIDSDHSSIGVTLWNRLFESTAIHFVHQQVWNHALSNGEPSPSEMRNPQCSRRRPLHYRITTKRTAEVTFDEEHPQVQGNEDLETRLRRQDVIHDASTSGVAAETPGMRCSAGLCRDTKLKPPRRRGRKPRLSQQRVRDDAATSQPSG